MRSKVMGLGLAVTMLTMGTGCRALLFPLMLATRIAVTAAVVVASQPRVVVVENPPGYWQGPSMSAALAYGPSEPPVPPPPPWTSQPSLPPSSVQDPSSPPATAQFDAAAAHAALHAADPSACWAASAGVHGYGRARITFATDGSVQLVELTNPVQGAPPDSACISSTYGSIHVPPFGGSSVAVYMTFFVR